MSPGRRCGSGSAGRRPQVLVQHGDPLREQRIHIERELHGPLCGTGHAPHNVISATRGANPVFISRTRLQGPPRPHSRVQQPGRPHSSGQSGGPPSNRTPPEGLCPAVPWRPSTSHQGLTVNSRGDPQDRMAFIHPFLAGVAGRVS